MSVSQAKISVVVPLFNKGDTIGRALESVVAQTRAPVEVIVVDDGSRDDSATQSQLVGRRLPGFKLIKQMNSGVSVARNRGVAESGAPWIAFLDADDIWRPRHLEELIALATQFPHCAMLGTRFREVPLLASLETIDDLVVDRCLIDYFSAAAGGNVPFFTSTVMADRHALIQTGGFPVGLSRGEDVVVWSLLAAAGQVAMSSYIGGYYMRTAGGLTQTMADFPNKAIETYHEIAARRDIERQTAHNAREAGNRLALVSATEAIMAGRKDVASLFLDAASTTKQYVRQRRMLTILSRFPAFAGAFVMNGASAVRKFLRSS